MMWLNHQKYLAMQIIKEIFINTFIVLDFNLKYISHKKHQYIWYLVVVAYSSISTLNFISAKSAVVVEYIDRISAEW